jgi:hypothetical protein
MNHVYYASGGIEFRTVTEVRIERTCAVGCVAGAFGGFISGWDMASAGLRVEGVCALSCCAPQFYGGGISYNGLARDRKSTEIEIIDANFTSCMSGSYGSSILIATENAALRRIVTSANLGPWGISMYYLSFVMEIVDSIVVDAPDQMAVCIVPDGPRIEIDRCLFSNAGGPQVYEPPGTIRVRNCRFSVLAFPSQASVYDDGGNSYGTEIALRTDWMCTVSAVGVTITTSVRLPPSRRITSNVSDWVVTSVPEIEEADSSFTVEDSWMFLLLSVILLLVIVILILIVVLLVLYILRLFASIYQT